MRTTYDVIATDIKNYGIAQVLGSVTSFCLEQLEDLAEEDPAAAALWKLAAKEVAAARDSDLIAELDAIN